MMLMISLARHLLLQLKPGDPPLVEVKLLEHLQPPQIANGPFVTWLVRELETHTCSRVCRAFAPHTPPSIAPLKVEMLNLQPHLPPQGPDGPSAA